MNNQSNIIPFLAGIKSIARIFINQYFVEIIKALIILTKIRLDSTKSNLKFLYVQIKSILVRSKLHINN